MFIRNALSAVFLFFIFAVEIFALCPAPQSNIVNIDPFLALLDTDKNGSVGREEWKAMGLMEISFPLCDPDKDGRITRSEMAACAIPEEADIRKEGILTVYGGGRFVIASQGVPIPKPANAPPGIAQATQFAADSPYVEGGPTGPDFIKLFDADGNGKIDHAEWEKLKNSTVFKPFRWPQYNRNRDEWITLDEAPKAPLK
jgi:hypothetical protein